MTPRELRAVLAQGEDASVEFKRCGAQPERDTFETVCSFANRQGGTIFLGVNDDGTIEGIPPIGVRNRTQHLPDPFILENGVTVSARAIICRELGSGTRNLTKYSAMYSGKTPTLTEGDVFVAQMSVPWNTQIDDNTSRRLQSFIDEGIPSSADAASKKCRTSAGPVPNFDEPAASCLCSSFSKRANNVC